MTEKELLPFVQWQQRQQLFQLGVMSLCGITNIPGMEEWSKASAEWTPGKLGGVCNGESIAACKSFYGAQTDEDLEGIACAVCSRSKVKGW